MPLTELREILSQELQVDPQQIDLQAVSGGDIHSAHRAQIDQRSIFVKSNDARHAAVLSTEFTSLRAMQDFGLSNYPAPLFYVETERIAVLGMPFCQLAALDHDGAIQLAKDLAAQHSMHGQHFGWSEDNFIGLNAQLNTPCVAWGDFFVDQRLQPQLELAIDNQLDTSLVRVIQSALPKIRQQLNQQAVQPALLHGDLWGGNAAYDSDAQRPIMYDPAAYFGDPEVDLAMSELFGRFPAAFYRAYQTHHPQRPGYARRKYIYNLYHALNHFNLFGAGYVALLANHCREL